MSLKEAIRPLACESLSRPPHNSGHPCIYCGTRRQRTVAACKHCTSTSRVLVSQGLQNVCITPQLLIIKQWPNSIYEHQHNHRGSFPTYTTSTSSSLIYLSLSAHQSTSSSRTCDEPSSISSYECIIQPRSIQKYAFSNDMTRDQ